MEKLEQLANVLSVTVYCTQCFQKVRDGGGGALKIHSERNLEMGLLKFSDSLTFIDAYCFPV